MPSFIKGFVQVVAWYKDDQILLSQASIRKLFFLFFFCSFFYLKTLANTHANEMKTNLNFLFKFKKFDSKIIISNDNSIEYQ